jgi:hypothetical protein
MLSVKPRASVLAGTIGALVLGIAVPAEASPVEPLGAAAAISNAPCDPDGTTATDTTVAGRLNGVLTDKLDGAMSAYRVSCARMVVRAVRDRDMSRRAATIAIATTIVESGLQNHDEAVDHDSLGLFQQRASWGSAADRTDPSWATNAFLNKMVSKYPNGSWADAPIGEVAQAVQVSAFPDRYQVEAADAAKIVDAVWDIALGLHRPSYSGDARADLIVHDGTNINVRFNNGGGFDGGRAVSSGWGLYHGREIAGHLGRLYFADFNGDGRSDLVVHDGTNINVRLNAGSGFDGGRTVSSGWGLYHGKEIAGHLGRLYFADYNADGRADLIVHDGTDLNVRLNTGGGFDGGRTVSSGWGLYHGKEIAGHLGRLYFADYNGDGRSDLIVHDGTNIDVRLNTGGGFDGGRNVSSGWGLYHGKQNAGHLGRLYFG